MALTGKKSPPKVTKGADLRHALPARLLHWVYAPAVLTGIFSGFYINGPSRGLFFKSMNAAQKSHFVAQYLLLFAYLARVYYAVAAKNFREIIPGLGDLMDIPKFAKYELFLSKKKPKFTKYNPAQKIVFSLLSLLVPVQITTGLPLYAKERFQGVAALAGGLNRLRQMHYLAALLIAALAAGHIYFALTDSLKKLKSIFTGYK